MALKFFLLLIGLAISFSCYAEDCDLYLQFANRELNAKDFVVQSYINGGDDGDVFRVKRSNQIFVIKLFNPHTSFVISSGQHLEAMEIQDLLAKEGFAPKIIGIMGQEALHEFFLHNRRQLGFFRWHFSIFKHKTNAESAMVMEEVQGLSMKSYISSRKPRLTLTRAGYYKVLKKLELIELFLKEKRINSYDIDFMISPESDVKLIDLTRYEYQGSGTASYNNFFNRAITLLDLRIKHGVIAVID